MAIRAVLLRLCRRIGVLLVAIVCALTFGSLGYDGFSFIDDMMNGGKRFAAMGFGAGMVFNLANMLLVAAIAVAGLSVAFPVGIGLALIIGVVWNYAIRLPRQRHPAFCRLRVGGVRHYCGCHGLPVHGIDPARRRGPRRARPRAHGKRSA